MKHLIHVFYQVRISCSVLSMLIHGARALPGRAATAGGTAAAGLSQLLCRNSVCREHKADISAGQALGTTYSSANCVSALSLVICR